MSKHIISGKPVKRHEITCSPATVGAAKELIRDALGELRAILNPETNALRMLADAVARLSVVQRAETAGA